MTHLAHHPPPLALPRTVSGWGELLRAALHLPATQIWYPDHFHLHCCRTGARVLPQRRAYGRGCHGRSSAVLVLLAPVGPAADELCLTLTERTTSVSSHKGQMSFPGGRLDGAESPAQAAQRETREEVGLPPSCYTILGALSPIGTHEGAALVTPLVALAPQPVRPVCASTDEVASIHYLHLSHLLMHSAESHCRVIKHRSLSAQEPFLFPAFFASPSQHRPAPPLRPSPTATRLAEDASFLPMLPSDFPGKLVWGVTGFITCELLARLAAVLAREHPTLDAAKASELLRCSNVLARDPEMTHTA